MWWKGRGRFAQRGRFVTIVAMVALIGAVVPSFAAGGVPVLRDFEDLPVGTPLYNQYDGVTFVGGNSTNFDATHPVTIVEPQAGTISPTRAVQGKFQRACEFCGTWMDLSFAQAQSRVSLSTGLAEACPNCTTGETMLMQGYDSDPSTNSTAKLVNAQAAPCLGKTTTPVTTPLEVDDANGTITYVRLWIVDCNDPMNPQSGGVNGTILFDNLLYDRPLNPPARESDPPIIKIISPQEGATVTGVTPGELATDMQVVVTESALSQLTAQVNGHASRDVYYALTAPNTYSVTIDLRGEDGLVDGQNTVVISAVDFDRPPNRAQATLHFTFHVKPIPPPSTVDILPNAVEVTQSIDPGPHILTDNDFYGGGGYIFRGPYPVALFKGKPTLIRVYGAAIGTTNQQFNVPASISVAKDKCTSNCEIADFQPPMASRTTPNLSGITVAPVGTAAAQPWATSGKLSSTWNFLIPGDWTTQDLVATVTVNDGFYLNFPHQPEIQECVGGTSEQCYHNNTVIFHLHFVAPPEVTIHPVLIHVTGTFNGKTFNNLTPTAAQVDAVFKNLDGMYPAHVTRGSTFDITVDPGINKDDLLDRTKDFDGANGREMFVGLLPADQAGFNLAANEKNNDGSFVAGYGAVGGRGAWADANNPTDPAHELGHNIGFDHWACENGVSGDECGVFPISHGGLGGVGFDAANWRLIPRGDDSSNSTPHSHDFMSYGQLCGLYGGGPGCDLGEWVSWYSYNILQDHPGIDTYDTDDPPALVVRGRISPQGAATFAPIFQEGVTHPLSDTIAEDDPASIYTMQGFDAGGNTLFVHNFEPKKLDVHTADYGKAFLFDEAVPVFASLNRLDVKKGKQLLGSIINPAPGKHPALTITAPAAGNVWQTGTQQTIRWNPTSPAGKQLYALVQFSSDGGTTRKTLARNVIGNSYTVDVSQLPGTTNAQVFVQVSDGMNTASAASGIFTVKATPPTVHIVTPATGLKVVAHVPLTLEGTAYDRQETLDAAAYKWSSDRDGALGNGSDLTLTDLSPGHHKLTLTVTDKAGLIGTDTVEIDIVALPWAYFPFVSQ